MALFIECKNYLYTEMVETRWQDFDDRLLQRIKKGQNWRLYEILEREKLCYAHLARIHRNINTSMRKKPIIAENS